MIMELNRQHLLHKLTRNKQKYHTEQAHQLIAEEEARDRAVTKQLSRHGCDRIDVLLPAINEIQAIGVASEELPPVHI